jgi:hypothetical protein
MKIVRYQYNINVWTLVCECFRPIVTLLFECHFLFFSEEIEGNVTVIRNYQKLKDLQKNLVWPSVGELDSKSFIPEVYKIILHFTCIVKVHLFCNHGFNTVGNWSYRCYMHILTSGCPKPRPTDLIYN